MTDSNVIQFPVPCSKTESAEDMLRCWSNWEQLIEDITSPYHSGWVKSEWLCLQRRTQPEFVSLFELMGGGIGYGFMGFRDIEEGLLCEQAALSVGSRWRFIDYYRQNKAWGGDGLGILPLVLTTYERCRQSGLYEGRLLVPPSGD